MIEAIERQNYIISEWGFRNKVALTSFSKDFYLMLCMHDFCKFKLFGAKHLESLYRLVKRLYSRAKYLKESATDIL